jgi:hypothetical protein
MLTKSRQTRRQLLGDTCDELASMANIPTTSGKEKASPKPLLLEVFTSESARNR